MPPASLTILRSSPSAAVLAPRDHVGGPWEQQDGFEMVVYRILFDSEVIWGPVYISFLGSKSLKCHFCSGLFPYHLLIDF